MKKKMSHLLVSATCAGALALGGAGVAFATEVNSSPGSADVTIGATVATSTEVVISVTVPSTMALSITTDSIDNTFKSYTAPAVKVKNNATSNRSVKISLENVADTPTTVGAKTLLDKVDLTMKGSETPGVLLSAGSGKTDVLFASMARDTEADLTLTAAKKATNPPILSDTGYSVVTTLKVEALSS